MRTAAIGSNSAEKTVWWKVDLGRIFNIYDINILFKTYDGYGVKPNDMFIVYFTRVIDSAIPTFSLNCKNVKSQALFFFNNFIRFKWVRKTRSFKIREMLLAISHG